MRHIFAADTQHSAPGLYGNRGERPVLRSVQLRAEADGLVFELAVEQHYHNAGARNIEALYTFPLPPGAVLLAMELVIGGKVMQGRVALKAQAEHQYEDAIQRGDTALMVERAADGLYAVSLGNLMAGESVLVRYRYAQLLAYSHGQLRITVPTVVAPRYGDPHAAGLLPQHVPDSALQAHYPLGFQLVLKGELAGAKVASPSHALAVSCGAAQVEISLDGAATLDRDIVVTLSGLDGRSLATAARDGDGTVVLAGFCPAAGQDAAPPPLVLKLLVDCSGSMNGDSIQSAKRAMHAMLAQLDSRDRFSYSRFGNTVVHMSCGLQDATPGSVRQAASWVDATQADLGGTELGNALQSTLSLGDWTPADILLITDGEIWATEDVITAACRSGQRIFVVGIGAAPSANFLCAIAARTGGACEFIAPGEGVEAAVLRCFTRLRQARLAPGPVQWNAAPRWQSRRKAPMFYGETLHCFAGFEGAPPTTARLAWREEEGERSMEVALPRALRDGDTLARLAAAARMATLDKSERDALALEYQLVTEGTNLIVVHARDEQQRATDLPELRKVPQMQAAGWGGLGSAHGNFNQAPAVWRRESASDQIRAMEPQASTYDIPPFLRRQAEDAVPRHPVRDDLIDFLREWSRRARTGGMTWRVLIQLQGEVPDRVYACLLQLKQEGYAEAGILAAFFAALLPLGVGLSLSAALMAELQSSVQTSEALPELHQLMRVRLDALLSEVEEYVPPAPPAPPALLFSRWLPRLFGRGKPDNSFRSKLTD